MNHPAPLLKASIARATESACGQKMLQNLLAALDAMRIKRLISSAFKLECDYCSIGALGQSMGFNVKQFCASDLPALSALFSVPLVLVEKIITTNDDGGSRHETPELRWQRMRDWVSGQINKQGE